MSHMGNPEAGYINRIDRERQSKSPPEHEGRGKDAEGLVIEFLQTQFPTMRLRAATPEEDAGNRGANVGKRIDAVAYLEGKPALGLQITTSMMEGIRKKKIREIQDHPFIRLAEMRTGDIAIPRAIIFADIDEVEGLMEDHDFEKHVKFAQGVLEGISISLQYVLKQTKNPNEVEKLNELIGLFEKEKSKFQEFKSIH